MSSVRPQRPAGPSSRAIGSGAALIAVSQVVTAAVGAVTGVVVARVLGPEGTGAFNIIVWTLLMLGAFGGLGIPLGVAYYVSNRSWAPGDAARQVLLASIPLGLAVGLVGAPLILRDLGGLFGGVPEFEGALALLALPFLLAYNSTAGLALALGRYETYALVFAGQGLAALVLVGALAPTFGVGGAVLGLAASHVVPAAAMAVWALRGTTPTSGWLERTGHDLFRSARLGLKAYLTSALQFLSQRVDLLILNASASAATVGQYAVALSVTNLMLLLPRALSNVVLPRVAALDSGASSLDQRSVAVKSVRHTVIIVSACTLVLCGGVFAIPLVFGADFKPAIVPGLLLLPGSAALGVGYVLWATVTGKGRPEQSLYAALAITPPTILLFVLVVPTLGASGAALISSISYTATAIAGLVCFLRAMELGNSAELIPRVSDLADYWALATRALRRLRG